MYEGYKSKTSVFLIGKSALESNSRNTLRGNNALPLKGKTFRSILINTDKHHYYPTALRRVQITLMPSTNITRYSYSRGPVRQVSCR